MGFKEVLRGGGVSDIHHPQWDSLQLAEGVKQSSVYDGLRFYTHL